MTNKYRGICHLCHKEIEIEEGTFVHVYGTKNDWKMIHNTCPEVLKATPPKTTPQRTMYRFPKGGELK